MREEYGIQDLSPRKNPYAKPCKLYVPKIDHYIDWLGSISYRDFYDTTTYSERSYELLDELFALVKQITPTTDTGARELWLCAERGSIDDFGKYEDYLDEEVVSNYEDFENLWKEYYPEDVTWYHFLAIESNAGRYRAVFLNHKHILEQDASKEKSTFTHDVSELLEWLIESIKEIITELKAGTYNERITRELPPQHRTGTISRKDLWDTFPEERKAFFADFPSEDVQEFIELAAKQPKSLRYIKNKRAEMTLNDFLNCCAIGYKANYYEGCDLSPREQYLKHADGRDDGLLDIAPDSVEAFIDWLDNSKYHIGHPWEICRGGNSTHIDLFVQHDEGGFSLVVAGSAWTRTVEAIKIYLALHRAGWPVYLHEADILSDRVQEKERIGIVPEGVFPAYCSSYFPDENIIDFENLPLKHRDELASKCTWQPLKEIALCSEGI